eukprot:gnl/Trimastix_PCT/1774.p1 GENE.gnl/Trimastix_PCT/1774~~gnl/Trimastix_PCT/1774.p1  ORF type:complete len:250 (-),score=35.14 gnl/Trimastix_PCT/1774:205-954(-)
MSKGLKVLFGGLRPDGRRPEELRTISCELGVYPQADGSAIFTQGQTKVLATVSGPKEAIWRSQSLHDRAFITCDFCMSPFSATERRRRGLKSADRRSTEIGLLIHQTMDSVVMTELYPRSQIDISVTVLQADGGTRCAAVNAATLALIDAGVAMKDFVVGCAAGYLQDTPLLDLNYLEDSSGGPDLPVALLAKTGEISLMQSDAQLPLDQFHAVFELACRGCREIARHMKDAVRSHTQRLLEQHATIPG